MPDEGLRLVCEMFGWQGGTIHQVKAEIVRLREVEKFAVNVVKLLKTAERSGNEKDEPEGSRVIMISDTLANELVEACEKSKSQDKGD